MTSFVGREAEVAELVRIAGHARLVTLTGPGGSGKSRLALAVADRVRWRFPDGVWFVGLAALREPAAVGPAIAETVGLPEAPHQPAAGRLVTRLRAARALLVCDNCEHLVGAAAELIERLLRECRDLRILATSREVLGVPGEVTFAVPPLPTPGTWSSFRDLAGFAAIRLFCDRARAASPGFELSESNAAAVAQVCRRLDGIPLAIELAAARVQVLSPGQIAERLDDCLGMLVCGDRAAAERHRTLQATMDWSHRLLTAAERGLFGRLSAFPGRFALDAAEAIGGASGESGPGGPPTLELLSGLVSRSLVVVEHGREARYRLLEPVRQYAAGKLAESGDAATVRDRHARYFIDLAESAESKLDGGEQAWWLDLLESERDNFDVAHRWCVQKGTDGALRLAAALWWFCYLRGHYRQGRRWLADALDAAPDAPPPLHAKALVAAGMLAHLECDYDLATGHLRAALSAYRDLADRRGMALGLQVLGSVARERGDYARSRTLHEESLSLWRALADELGVARSLNYLGFAAWLEQDYERAVRLSGQARSLFHRAGDGEGTAWSLINLGTVALYRGDRASAQALLRESLARSRRTDYREGVAWALNQLGVLALRHGDHDRAEDLLRESLTVHRELGDRWRIAGVLDGLAGTAIARGDPLRAIRLLASGTGLREIIGTPVPPAERAAHQRAIADARAAAPDDFDEHWAAGLVATPEQVIDEAATAGIRRASVSTPDVLLRVLALGPARVYRGADLLEPADWTYAKPRELLFYLLSQDDCTKEQIGAALWPWSSNGELRNSFHTTLHHLRRAIGRPDCVLYRRGRYAFNRSLGVAFDVADFQAGLARARAVSAEAVQALTEAVGLYRGDFLADQPGEQWIDARRSALRRSYEDALLALGGLHATAGRHAEAVEVYLRAVAHDALLETAHRELIRCYARLGEHGLALRHYRRLVKLLKDELGVGPSPQTGALFKALRDGQRI